MLANKVRDRTAVIGVVGLGYVGLPLAIAFAREGFAVEGFDVQPSKVISLRRGYTLVEDVDPPELQSLLAKRKLNFTFKLPDKWAVDVAIICVPTPITEDKKPDLRYITDAVNQMEDKLSSRDTMVVLESSTYPGTTRDVVLPALAKSARYVAYSPERIDPGNKKYGIKNTPKLVGGSDKESTELATLLYSCIVDKVIPVSSLEVAETAKLFENIFRNVNIALVNELTRICAKLGISVWEVIDAASTKPFGFMPFYPGVGVGGHCLPVDPYYLVDKANTHHISTELIRTALVINEGMPSYVVSQVAGILQQQQGKYLNQTRILVLGVAFKRDIGDIRGSPSIELLKILMSWGVDVLYNDPYVDEVTINGSTLRSVAIMDEVCKVDCVILATDHSCYNYTYIVGSAKLVFDTRGVTKNMTGDNIRRLGEKGD